MSDNTPVYEWEDAINFIAERSNIDKNIIEKILELEEDYMRSIGIIVEDELTEKQRKELFMLDGRQRTSEYVVKNDK